MPLKAARGENILATTYFHRGYEEPMIKVARLSDFNAVLVGNGLESTTLFGVHKPTEVFIVSGKTDLTQRRITISEALSRKESDRIRKAYGEVRTKKSNLTDVTVLGEQALKNGTGPAAPLIAWQAGSLAYFSGLFPSIEEGYWGSIGILERGVSWKSLEEYLKKS